MTKEWIWFDMDGTIADLYGVNGWLDDLQALKTRPYEKAKVLYDEIDLILTLADLKAKGYKLGIISWLARANDEEYAERIRKAKVDWLLKNCLLDLMDEVLITPYGVKKADTCRPYGNGILVDDERQNRNDWDLGKTINANLDIIKQLRAL